jgi:hypothetical protein
MTLGIHEGRNLAVDGELLVASLDACVGARRTNSPTYKDITWNVPCCGRILHRTQDFRSEGTVKSPPGFLCAIGDISGSDRHRGVLNLDKPVDSRGLHLVCVVSTSTIKTSLDLDGKVASICIDKHPCLEPGTMKILFLLFLLLLMDYACVPPCPQRFTGQNALSIHQAKCKFATAPDPALDAALERRKARKRRKLDTSVVDSPPTLACTSADSAPHALHLTLESTSSPRASTKPEFSRSEPASNFMSLINN